MPEERCARFSIGDVVRHRLYPFRGVIIDVDPVFANTEEWPAAQNVMRTLHRTIHDDQPYTFLYETRRLAVYGPRLTDVVVDLPSDPLAHLERFRLR